jgi:hypothetical protein
MASLLDNPELTAMAGIVEILKDLPDEASRLRVMRWAFGRFTDEFKRPTAPLTAAPVPAPARTAEPLDIKTVLAVAPELASERTSTTADFARQISELNDLFPQKAERPADPAGAAWVETVAI